MSGMIAAAGSFPSIAVGSPAGVDGAAYVVVVVETLMYQDTSLVGHTEGVRWLALGSCRRDNELSACYAAARSSNVRISRRARRSSDVAASGRPCNKAVAAAMF